MKKVQELDLRGLHVLDGAMATELEARGCDLSGPLWSARVLESNPQTIAAVHRDYLEAGADCLFTASYQISEEGFKKLGRGPAEAAAALRASVAIAEKVRKEYLTRTPARSLTESGTEPGRRIWIAASLGPYGATLHNGAEYHGNYDCGFEELVQFHGRRLAVIAETNADFVAFETIPSQEEAKAILAALEKHPGIPACLSFVCRDDLRLVHGERLSDCARMLDCPAQVVAVGVNCTHPKHVLNLICEILQGTRKPIFVNPNSGEHWDDATHCWQGTASVPDYARRARAWYAAGAQAVGGCCRTTPAHIRAAREALSKSPQAVRQ